jgi:hypothetical protein
VKFGREGVEKDRGMFERKGEKLGVVCVNSPRNTHNCARNGIFYELDFLSAIK